MRIPEDSPVEGSPAGGSPVGGSPAGDSPVVDSSVLVAAQRKEGAQDTLLDLEAVLPAVVGPACHETVRCLF